MHLAVTLESALMQDMTPAQFAGPLAAKLRSAQVLDAYLPEFDAFVLFSSVGAYLPQTGAANYAAANAGLDALAKNREARGQHAASIAWGVWKGAGLADGEGRPANTDDLERRGVTALSPARGFPNELGGWPRSSQPCRSGSGLGHACAGARQPP